jgi:putative oligomerization/nucleic acid binding protein
MPLIGRRRPLMRAAMVGGAGYVAGKRRAQSQEHEAEQDAGLQQAQTGQAPAPAGGGMSEMDRIDALKKLGELHDSGVLTDEQFEAEKEKLI